MLVRAAVLAAVGGVGCSGSGSATRAGQQRFVHDSSCVDVRGAAVTTESNVGEAGISHTVKFCASG